MSELRPCPFCGGGASVKNLGSPMVVCLHGCCHIYKEPVIENWNTRPIEDAQAQEIERLRKGLVDFREYFLSYHENGYSNEDIEALKIIRDALKGVQHD